MSQIIQRIKSFNHKSLGHLAWIVPLAVFLMSVTILQYNFTSNVHEYAGLISDQSLFRYMGEAWVTKGAILYKELFDHKGPLLFLIQGLFSIPFPYPDLLGFKIMVTLNLMVSITLAYACFAKCIDTKLISNKILSIGSTIILFLCFQPTITGNNCEEYMLTIMLGILYLFLRVWNQKDELKEKQILSTCFWIGFLSMLIVLIRPNNVAPIAAFLIGFMLLMKMNFKLFFKGIGLALLGGIIPFGIFSVYFCSVGAFGEFMEGLITFSLNYVGTHTSSNSAIDKHLSNYGYYYITAIIVQTLYLERCSRKIKIAKKKLNYPDIEAIKKEYSFGFVVLLYTLITIAIILIGLFTVHYWLMFLPCFLLTIILIFQLINDLLESKRMRGLKYGRFYYGIALIILLILCEVQVKIPAHIKANQSMNIEDKEKNDDYYNETLEYSLALKDKDFFTYMVGPVFYWENGTLPKHRYWTFQELWGQTNPAVCVDIQTYIVNAKPENILVGTKVNKSNQNEAFSICKQVEEEIKNNYIPEADSDYYTLYNRIEGTQ